LDPDELFKALVTHIKPFRRPVGKAPPLKVPATIQPTRTIQPFDLPGIDTASALGRVGGDPEALIRLLIKFSGRHAGAINAIADLLNSGETQKAWQAAHTLKGVAGNIGAVELHQAAAKLEQAIKEKRAEQWETALELTRRMLGTVMASIRSLEAPGDDQALSAGAVETGQPPDRAAIITTLADIKKLLEQNNFSAGKPVQRLVAGLKHSKFHDQSMALKKFVERYHFKEALKALDRLEKLVLEKQTLSLHNKGERDDR
jgi:two-component system sensor histidine kinase/response regulator